MIPFIKPGWNQKFLSWFRFIMASCYILIGLAVLGGIGDLFANQPPVMRYGFGSLLLAYGLFRSWRIYKDDRQQRQPYQ